MADADRYRVHFVGGDSLLIPADEGLQQAIVHNKRMYQVGSVWLILDNITAVETDPNGSRG